MKIEALNCPNCGAGVASDHTLCEFCKTRLKTMACPACLGLMFLGTEFCGRCGANVIAATTRQRSEPGDCPRCRTKLDVLTIDDIELDECRKCGGIWADTPTFESICATREDQSSVLIFTKARTSVPAPQQKVSYVPCPDCKHLMNRSNFARASGVIIDACKQHGVWFDADELPKIIRFIQTGGLQLAREKEKQEISDERRRLREDERKQAAMDQRHGVGGSWNADESSAIKRFIRGLFD